MNIEIEFFAHAVPVYVSPIIVVPHPTPPPLQGLHGDMVLVASVNTGTAKVKIRLRQRAWQGVEPDISSY